MRCVGWGMALGRPAIAAGASGMGGGDCGDDTRTRDVIYGRKFGLAPTMDVFTPKKGPMARD